MDAKKCDRCGRYYEPDVVKFSIGNVNYQNHGSVYMYPIDLAKSIDLCPECCRSFEQWLNQTPTPHLIDITCSWELEELCGLRLYAIAPGCCEDCLTDKEAELLQFSREWSEKHKKE